MDPYPVTNVGRRVIRLSDGIHGIITECGNYDDDDDLEYKVILENSYDDIEDQQYKVEVGGKEVQIVDVDDIEVLFKFM